MAVYNLTNSISYEYMRGYYHNNNLIKPVDNAQTGAIYNTMPNYASSTWYATFNVDNIEYDLTIAPYGSNQIQMLLANMDGDYLSGNQIDALNYDFYVTFTPSNSARYGWKSTYYLQGDMLEGYGIIIKTNQTTYYDQLGNAWTSSLQGTMTLGVTAKQNYRTQHYNNLINEFYEDGYNQGYTSGVTDTNVYSGATGVISNAVEGFASLLNHEIMPNVTIGGVLSIPLIIITIATIFKVLK